MSTTFEVFPGNDVLPPIGKVLDLSTRYLHEHLGMIGIHLKPTVELEIRNDYDLIAVPRSDQALKWNEDQYGWFTVNQVPGGCDAYFEYVDDIRRDSWEDEIMASAARCADFVDDIEIAWESDIIGAFGDQRGNQELSPCFTGCWLRR